MKLDELKKQSNAKILLRGKSARGKTRACAIVALEVSAEGRTVKYVDTEAEGSTTIVNLIEEGEYSEGDVENINYIQVDNYDQLIEEIPLIEQREYDLLIIDTLDHKHSFTIRKVMEDVIESEEAGDKMSPDWNMYPEIYSREKEIMELVGKSKTNILATLDPDSGKMDKPKGTQTNVHGYFSAVIDMKKSNDEWTNQVVNWIGNSDWIGRPHKKLATAIIREVLDRTKVNDEN